MFKRVKSLKYIYSKNNSFYFRVNNKFNKLHETNLGEVKKIYDTLIDNTYIFTIVNFKELFNLFIANKNSSNTIKNYESRFNRLKALHNVNIRKITNVTIYNTLTNLKLTVSTYNNYILFIKAMLNNAYDNNLIDRVPPLKTKKYDNKRTRIIDSNQYELLLKTIKKDSQLTLLTELLYHTGKRLNEIYNIKENDIDLNKRTIKIINTKNNNKKEIIFINNKLLTILENSNLVTYKNTNSIFKLNNKYIQIKLLKILKNLFNNEVEDSRDNIVIHSIRHTFCSNLIANNVPLETVAALAGHDGLSNIMRYVKIKDSNKINAINTL